MSTDRFDDETTEAIYQRDPDEEVGTTLQLGWAGLYLEGRGGHILFETPQGKVHRMSYSHSADLLIAWPDVMGSLTIGPEPEEGDTVIFENHDGFVVLPCHERFPALWQALRFCRETKKVQNAWVRDEQGNFTMIDL